MPGTSPAVDAIAASARESRATEDSAGGKEAVKDDACEAAEAELAAGPILEQVAARSARGETPGVSGGGAGMEGST